MNHFISFGSSLILTISSRCISTKSCRGQKWVSLINDDLCWSSIKTMKIDVYFYFHLRKTFLTIKLLWKKFVGSSRVSDEQRPSRLSFLSSNWNESIRSVIYDKMKKRREKDIWISFSDSSLSFSTQLFRMISVVEHSSTLSFLFAQHIDSFSSNRRTYSTIFRDQDVFRWRN